MRNTGTGPTAAAASLVPKLDNQPSMCHGLLQLYCYSSRLRSNRDITGRTRPYESRNMAMVVQHAMHTMCAFMLFLYVSSRTTVYAIYMLLMAYFTLIFEHKHDLDK